MIESLVIKTKKDIFSRSSGVFSSNISGEGYDFLEMREYTFADDAKKIDWLVSAKMQKPYMRVYQEEKLRNIVIIFLLGGSLFFGSKRLKIETLLEAFLLLGFSAVKNSEPVRVFADGMEVCKNLFEVEKKAKEIAKTPLVGRMANYDITPLFYRIKERSLVILLGDFLEPIDVSLFAKKHEVVAFVARDSIERGMDINIASELVDSETLDEKSALLDNRSLYRYGENIEKALKQNYLHFLHNRVDFLELFDDDEIFGKMQKFFIGR